MSYKIYDSDRHVMEPLTIWQQYVDQDIVKDFPISFKTDTPAAAVDRAQRLGPKSGVPIPPTYMIGDQPILANWGEDLQVASAYKGKSSNDQRKDAMEPIGQLRSMDETGIAQARLFPTFAAYVVNHCGIPAEVSLAYAEGYNRWLYDYCQADPSRLKGVGLISRHEPSNMVNQVEQIADYGWSCVVLRPEVICGRDLGHADYQAFWRACEDKGIAIAFHGGTHLHAPTAGTERFSSRFALHACSHPVEAQMAFVALLESGVFERHPGLKFGFLEAGASWIPHWLWRLDNICYPEFAMLTEQNIRQLPSAYFKRQCWVAIEIEEPCLAQVVEMVGQDRLLFGTDFPHPDHLEFDISDIGSVCSDLTPQQLTDMLENNPKAFFGD
ncbi:MAG: putative TIM-barrel fold metal-dependent hydrolase [Phenylobacterium sp.]|jgi:predicted TIM-barrel fold metal-dependent hydrolase